MIDVIIHVPNVAAHHAELESLGFETLPVLARTPDQVAGNEFMTLVRVNSADDLTAFSSVVILGSYEEVFADPDKRAIYDRIYPRTPVVWTDEAGQRQEYVPPEKFGVFA